MEENAALPRLRLRIAPLCALFAFGALAGCTTAELASDAGIEPQLFSFDETDPVLPDTLDAVPVASTAQASAPDIAPVAYAGQTPDTPASAALMQAEMQAQPASLPETQAETESQPETQVRHVAARSPELDALIAKYAAHHEIPLELLRRVVNRESTFNPAARNGPYWGLMQILPQTARTMGYRGSPEGLLDAETNLKYAGKYLRGAYMVADGDQDMAVRHYSRGYYYHARDRGMLGVTGLGKDRRRMQVASSN